MLGLRVDALPDKSLRVRGAFGEESLVCHPDRTSRRRFDSTKPTELRFRALLTEGDAQVVFHREEFGRRKVDLA
jgi:hypothetical protein